LGCHINRHKKQVIKPKTAHDRPPDLTIHTIGLDPANVYMFSEEETCLRSAG
jgi:hypothetical protein